MSFSGEADLELMSEKRVGFWSAPISSNLTVLGINALVFLADSEPELIDLREA